jgi:hypothetical protein
MFGPGTTSSARITISTASESSPAFLSLFMSVVVKPDLAQPVAFSFFEVDSITAGCLMTRLVGIVMGKREELELLGYGSREYEQ